MMFGQDRHQLRRFYYQIWTKMQHNQKLDGLEAMIAQVIHDHPEYQSIFNNETNLDQDYFVEDGQTNPFLHMGLHIAIHEQISTDRPVGIRNIYQKLQYKYSNPHHAEHAMMECLTESLWLAQRNNQPPDDTEYLSALKKLL